MRKIPIIVTIIYLILVLFSLSYIFSGDDPLSGILAIVLTLPWSSLFSRLLPGSAFDSIAVGLLVAAVGATINAAILYFGSHWLVSRLA